MDKDKNYLNNDEVNKLISEVRKDNNNDAWVKLCDNFKNYISKRVRKYLLSRNLAYEINEYDMEDLRMAGWSGFIEALGNFDESKGHSILTYATYYIDGEIKKALNKHFNNNKYVITESVLKSQNIDITDIPDNSVSEETDIHLETPTNFEKFKPERRVLQILDILRKMTDEEHTMTKKDILDYLKIYRIVKYKNDTTEAMNTITSTIESIIMELCPMEYTGDNDDEYIIKYDGYKENALLSKINKEKSKASNITNFSYKHLFSNHELDIIIQVICFSDLFSYEEKKKIITKILSTASINYKSPFSYTGEIKFNTKGIYGRFSGRDVAKRKDFSQNIKIIQEAIKNLGQIRFIFNRYNDQRQLVPTTQNQHVLSPYHVVVYHDNYYCIGLKNDNKKIWHYRIDLMSDIEIIKDDNGGIVPIEICRFDGLPISSEIWNPEKYMSEHLYMAYDEPDNIRIKIKNTDYTIVQDWFGSNYEKSTEKCEDGYDIINVKTSKTMIVHWAMQYGSRVEILNEDVRQEIKSEIEQMKKMYDK